MGDILGIGVTHYPPGLVPDEHKPWPLVPMLQGNRIPAHDSPWRAVLMASSSWSHGFLTEKNALLYPDLDADRILLKHLKAGDYLKWKDAKLEDVEQSGQQEVLNWFCLVGAMDELSKKVDIVEWAESWTFNAKCLAGRTPTGDQPYNLTLQPIAYIIG